MTWNTPTTAVAGETALTANFWNEQVRDNLIDLDSRLSGYVPVPLQLNQSASPFIDFDYSITGNVLSITRIGGSNYSWGWLDPVGTTGWNDYESLIFYTQGGYAQRTSTGTQGADLRFFGQNNDPNSSGVLLPFGSFNTGPSATTYSYINTGPWSISSPGNPGTALAGTGTLMPMNNPSSISQVDTVTSSFGGSFCKVDIEAPLNNEYTFANYYSGGRKTSYAATSLTSTYYGSTRVTNYSQPVYRVVLFTAVAWVKGMTVTAFGKPKTF